jgi:hypothetical protein
MSPKIATKNEPTQDFTRKVEITGVKKNQWINCKARAIPSKSDAR